MMSSRSGIFGALTFTLLSLFARNLHADGVLFVGAHPDDEYYAAPILDQLCNKMGLQCNFLVITDGGKGQCLLSQGCSPSVAAVRAVEMQTAASYFNARLGRFNLQDTASSTLTGDLYNWNQEAGGTNSDVNVITSAIGQVIRAVSPQVIISFDPRHGTSCHVDHRAASALALQAAKQLGFNLDYFWMIESLEIYGINSSGQVWEGNSVMVPSDTSVAIFGAASTWSARLQTLSTHASQFSSATVAMNQRAPSAQQIVPILRASQAVTNDARYSNLCIHSAFPN